MLSIVTELQLLKQNYQQKATLKDCFRVGMISLMPWLVILVSLLCVAVLLVQSVLKLSNNVLSLWCGMLLLCLILFNVCLVMWKQVRKRREVLERISWLIEIIKDASKAPTTEAIIDEFLSYIRSCETTSFLSGPSHNFTMLYLKGSDEPVYFPTSLVATGDTIGLCTGQPSPCNAVCFLDKCITLNKGESFSRQELNQQHSCPEGESSRLHKFSVVRSPAVEEIEKCLDMSNKSKKRLFSRPNTMLTKKREEVVSFLVKIVIPVLSVLVVVTGIAWFFLLSYYSKTTIAASGNYTASSLLEERNSDNFWYELVLTSTALILLPLLPILSPFLWIILYMFGEARTLAPIFEKNKQRSFDSKGATTPTTYSVDEMLSDSSSSQAPQSTWFQLLPKVLLGDRRLFSLNAGMFDVLGSLTALCCINKEGVLSWYDPAPEKVCFFSQTNDVKAKQEEDISIGVSQDSDSSNIGDSRSTFGKTFHGNHSDHLEITTLSQGSQISNKLHFDDPDWMRFLPSLKAIGLNILATNAMRVHEEEIVSLQPPECHHGFSDNFIRDFKEMYRSQKETEKRNMCRETLLQHQNQLKLCSYELECAMPEITCLKPGLCNLAELTGFEENVLLLYPPKLILTTYKKNSLLKRSISKKFQKSPPTSEVLNSNSNLDYLHGVVVSRWPKQAQDYLLVSGSGDLVVQRCSHYWDGADIQEMNDMSTRRVLDFCHRSIITGSCIAFSFRPVTSNFKGKGSCIKQFVADGSDDFPSSQIFQGAVSMQYQARINVFHLIEALDNASIRFVHFSPEDEFKARVFAEKMGLEVGWNCHISLCSKNHRSSEGTSLKPGSLDSDDVEDDEPSVSLLYKHSPQTPLSESSFSDSAFHALNRAKLPRGIENIIPHIENVDNVPLLVPLFTDCEQKSTMQMIEIMQKYDEVVCCIGSSDSIDNIPVFAKADISIGLQPVLTSHGHMAREKTFSTHGSPRFDASLYQLNSDISQASMNTSNHDMKRRNYDGAMMSLSRNLITFPCSVSLSSDDSLAVIYDMIKQARHCLFLSHVSLVFYMKCLAMVSLIQLFAHVLHLPLIFTPLDVFWLAYVIIPCLSFSILASSRDRDLMTWASIKNTSRQSSSSNAVRENVKHFATKFAPSCLVVVALYVLGVASACRVVEEDFAGQSVRFSNTSNNSNLHTNVTFSVKCYPWFTVETNGTTTTTLSQSKATSLQYFSEQKTISQQICLCALVLYTCIISSAYVHRWKMFIKQFPFSNKVWLTAVFVIFLSQIVYSSVTVTVAKSDENLLSSNRLLGPLEPVIWSIFFIWPLPLFVFNEVAKYKEIRMWNRSQKRARLAFGTKLGMNSPF